MSLRFKKALDTLFWVLVQSFLVMACTSGIYMYFGEYWALMFLAFGAGANQFHASRANARLNALQEVLDLGVEILEKRNPPKGGNHG